ncbi:hypothetical protein F5Y15DRAFT_14144 [Xylariaceae sp. FL0016]|nr:hypothetical protein F5Y15DRAFT_14144 [Xylariaceae sp. FL0016]
MSACSRRSGGHSSDGSGFSLGSGSPTLCKPISISSYWYCPCSLLSRTIPGNGPHRISVSLGNQITEPSTDFEGNSFISTLSTYLAACHYMLHRTMPITPKRIDACWQPHLARAKRDNEAIESDHVSYLPMSSRMLDSSRGGPGRLACVCWVLPRDKLAGLRGSRQMPRAFIRILASTGSFAACLLEGSGFISKASTAALVPTPRLGAWL